MAINIDDIIRKLPKARQARIEKRAAELIENELTLRDLRRRLSMTQGQLAKRLGKKQGNVSRLERARDWKLSTLHKVLEAMGVEVTFLIKAPGQKLIKVQNLFGALGGGEPLRRKQA